MEGESAMDRKAMRKPGKTCNSQRRLWYSSFRVKTYLVTFFILRETIRKKTETIHTAIAVWTVTVAFGQTRAQVLQAVASTQHPSIF